MLIIEDRQEVSQQTHLGKRAWKRIIGGSSRLERATRRIRREKAEQTVTNSLPKCGRFIILKFFKMLMFQPLINTLCILCLFYIKLSLVNVLA